MSPGLDIAFKSVRAGNTTERTLLRASESLFDDFFYRLEVGGVQVLQEADRIFLYLNY